MSSQHKHTDNFMSMYMWTNNKILQFRIIGIGNHSPFYIFLWSNDFCQFGLGNQRKFCTPTFFEWWTRVKPIKFMPIISKIHWNLKFQELLHIINFFMKLISKFLLPTKAQQKKLYCLSWMKKMLRKYENYVQKIMKF